MIRPCDARGASLLTLMGLAYGATLCNLEEAKELVEKVLSRAVVGDKKWHCDRRETLLAFPGGRTEALVAQTAQQCYPVGKPTREKCWLYYWYVVKEQPILSSASFYVERFENTGLRWMSTFYKVRCLEIQWLRLG